MSFKTIVPVLVLYYCIKAATALAQVTTEGDKTIPQGTFNVNGQNVEVTVQNPSGPFQLGFEAYVSGSADNVKVDGSYSGISPTIYVNGNTITPASAQFPKGSFAGFQFPPAVAITDFGDIGVKVEENINELEKRFGVGINKESDIGANVTGQFENLQKELYGTNGTPTFPAGYNPGTGKIYLPGTQPAQ